MLGQGLACRALASERRYCRGLGDGHLGGDLVLGGRTLQLLELQFEELESSATEDEIAAEMAVAKTTTVAAFTRKRPARKPLPEHLPRERVIVPGPTTCLCCGGKRLRKLDETVTETLESIPRQWKVIQHVREKFTCRDCEKISQAPAPFHVIADRKSTR